MAASFIHFNKTVLSKSTLTKVPIKCCNQSQFFVQKNIHTSSSVAAGALWRRKHGLPSNIVSNYGPLTDLPDWSYKDGTPGSLNGKQRLRHEKRKKLAFEVVRLLKEMDLAEYLKKKNDLDAALETQRIESERLKPKGLHLLKSSEPDIADPKIKVEEEVIDRSKNVLEIKSEPTTGEFDPNYSISMPPLTDDIEDTTNPENIIDPEYIK